MYLQGMSGKSWCSLIEATSDDIRRLSAVDRFSSIPVSVKETVAEHSFWVTLYAAAIYRFLESPDHLYGPLLLRAVTHDLEECISGDIVRPLKYSTPELKEEVDRASEMLLNRMVPEEILDLRKELVPPGEDWDYINCVVKAADWLSLFQYMRREAARGNREIIPFYNRMIRDLSEAAKQAPDYLVSFYNCLISEANGVLRDCFGRLLEKERWNRVI